MSEMNKDGTDLTSAVFVCEECGAEVEYDKIGAHIRVHEAEAGINGDYV